MTPELKQTERIDDLQINGLKLIQDAEKYCFTSDAVLLANTVTVNKKSKVLDIGTGSGIIAVLLAGKKNAAHVTAVEIQPDMADIAERNVKLNNLDDKITVLNVAAQKLPDIMPVECFDVVVSNPPYKKIDAGEMDTNVCRAIGKYEIKLTLKELINTAARMVKYGGKFYLIHRADRLAECIYEMKLNKLEPKKMWLIRPRADKAADTVIFECIKGGKSGLKTDTVVVYGEDNEYTPRVKAMYYKD